MCQVNLVWIAVIPSLLLLHFVPAGNEIKIRVGFDFSVVTVSSA